MSIQLGQVPAVVISSPQAAELVLRTNDAVFASRPTTQASEYLAYGSKGIAFGRYGPYWRNMRKLCVTELFSSAKIDSFSAMRREEMGLLVEELKEAAVARKVVDVSVKVGKVIEGITYKMVLGDNKFDGNGLKEAVGEALTLAGAFNLADFVPFLGALDLQGFTKKLKALSKTVDNILEKIIDDHLLECRKDKEHQRDFVDVLLSLMNKPMSSLNEPQYTIGLTNVKAVILDILAGALETSYATIEWAMSELIRHPEVMKKLQQELESVVSDRMVEEADLAKLDYLNMVVKETFRLHPVAPLLVPHESTEDVTLDGYHIPKKSRIVVNFYAIGRDPNVWLDNAEEFVPERFVGSDIDLRGRDFQLIPFGSGRRMCPGINLGLIEVKLILAQLVHCFDWVLPNGMSPIDLDMTEKFGLAVPRANHLLAVPTYRLHA